VLGKLILLLQIYALILAVLGLGNSDLFLLLRNFGSLSRSSWLRLLPRLLFVQLQLLAERIQHLSAVYCSTS